MTQNQSLATAVSMTLLSPERIWAIAQEQCAGVDEDHAHEVAMRIFTGIQQSFVEAGVEVLRSEEDLREARAAGRAEAVDLLVNSSVEGLTVDETGGESGEWSCRFDTKRLRELLSPNEAAFSLIDNLSAAYWEQDARIDQLTDALNRSPHAVLKQATEDTRRIDLLEGLESSRGIYGVQVNRDRRLLLLEGQPAMSGFRSLRDALDTAAAYEKALSDGPEVEKLARASDWSRALVATASYLTANFTPHIARDIFEGACALLKGDSVRANFAAGVTLPSHSGTRDAETA